MVSVSELTTVTKQSDKKRPESYYVRLSRAFSMFSVPMTSLLTTPIFVYVKTANSPGAVPRTLALVTVSSDARMWQHQRQVYQNIDGDGNCLYNGFLFGKLSTRVYFPSSLCGKRNTCLLFKMVYCK